MYRFLKYAFSLYNFCLVKGVASKQTVIVLCKSKPTNSHLPESFCSLINYCDTVCDYCEDDDSDYPTFTYHFNRVTLCLIWEAES